jgi:hypothetical protein
MFLKCCRFDDILSMFVNRLLLPSLLTHSSTVVLFSILPSPTPQHDCLSSVSILNGCSTVHILQQNDELSV